MHGEGRDAHDAAMKSSKQLTCTSNLPSEPLQGNLGHLAHLSFPSTSEVPLLTELASASDAGNGENTLALLDEF